MKAAEFDRYGPSSVLRVREVPRPEPGPDELLIRVRAASINPKDILAREGKFRLFSGLSLPKRAGYDWSGEVEAAGRRVRSIRPGDALFGMLRPWGPGGTCAEYLLARPDQCAPKPPSLSFEEAAAVPLAALTAWQALTRLARVARGQRVLINGASGGVGVFAVQLARHLGAEVTTLSGDSNRALCESLGAHHALAYAQHPLGLGAFHLFFDVFGNQHLDRARPALTPAGLYVSTIPSPRNLRDALTTPLRGQRSRVIVVRPRRDDLATLAALIEQKALRVLVDQVFPLDQIAQAQDRVATKHAQGKVVVRV